MPSGSELPISSAPSSGQVDFPFALQCGEYFFDELRTRCGCLKGKISKRESANLIQYNSTHKFALGRTGVG